MRLLAGSAALLSCSALLLDWLYCAQPLLATLQALWCPFEVAIEVLHQGHARCPQKQVQSCATHDVLKHV